MENTGRSGQEPGDHDHHLMTKWLKHACTYTNHKKIRYADWRLCVVRQLFRSVPICFIVYVIFVLREQKSTVTTFYYFDISSSQGIVRINDTLAGSNVRYDVFSILMKEGDQTMFVPTVLTSRYQVYRVCSEDALNPGVPCTKDTDCIQYYEQANATCRSSTKTCDFDGLLTWCTVNSTASSLFPYREMLSFTVIARVACVDKIFSNYHRGVPKQQYFYELNAHKLLAKATQNGKPIATKANYREYFKSGADVVVSYSWWCDLGLNLGRYDCPIQQSVELLSSTAQTSRSLITALSTSADGQATRQQRVLTGLRFRLESRGGCYQTTFAAYLTILVKGFAIESIGTLLMGVIIIMWHWWYRVPRTDEIFKRNGRNKVKLVRDKKLTHTPTIHQRRGWLGNLLAAFNMLVGHQHTQEKGNQLITNSTRPRTTVQDSPGLGYRVHLDPDTRPQAQQQQRYSPRTTMGSGERASPRAFC